MGGALPPRNRRGFSANPDKIHADHPPVRPGGQLLPKSPGHSANGIFDTDNKGNSSTADISSSLNSTSSNDNRSVGKVGTNGNLSDAVTGGISPQQNYSRQSVGNPSSMQEADAKQNEGEHNTYPQHLAGGQTQQSNGSNANGYKANSYNNGNQKA